MKEMLFAVCTNTESYFDLIDGKQSKTTVEIKADAIKSGLFAELGQTGTVIYLTIMAHYDDEQGLPDEHEMAKILDLDSKVVASTIQWLLKVKINKVPLFNKQRLSERNKKNHAVYTLQT